MIILRQKKYSKGQDRGIVPKDIAEKGKKDGVVQKDEAGNWRIISYKTNPPTFWNSKYETKSNAEAALRGYQANKH